MSFFARKTFDGLSSNIPYPNVPLQCHILNYPHFVTHVTKEDWDDPNIRIPQADIIFCEGQSMRDNILIDERCQDCPLFQDKCCPQVTAIQGTENLEFGMGKQPEKSRYWTIPVPIDNLIPLVGWFMISKGSRFY